MQDPKNPGQFSLKVSGSSGTTFFDSDARRPSDGVIYDLQEPKRSVCNSVAKFISSTPCMTVATVGCFLSMFAAVGCDADRTENCPAAMSLLLWGGAIASGAAAVAGGFIHQCCRPR